MRTYTDHIFYYIMIRYMVFYLLIFDFLSTHKKSWWLYICIEINWPRGDDSETATTGREDYDDDDDDHIIYYYYTYMYII